MLHSIQELHELGFLQRDVKPSNFAIGRYKTREHRLVIMLDFGISRYYLDYRKRLLAARPSPGWRGTSRYCSLNNHLNLVYIIIYLYIAFFRIYLDVMILSLGFMLPLNF